MIEKISNEEARRNGVSSLAARPNGCAKYGASGLTAEQLRSAFDALALLAISKLNEVIDFINGTPAAGGSASGGTGSSSGVSLTQLNSLLATKADTDHNHDGRYYSSIALDFLLDALLPKKPDGTTDLIGTDGKISSSYLPAATSQGGGSSVGVSSVNGKQGSVTLGAGDIGVADAGNLFSGSTLEEILSEIGKKVLTLESSYYGIYDIGEDFGIEYSYSISPDVSVVPSGILSYYDDGGVMEFSTLAAGECTVTLGSDSSAEVYKILVRSSGA